MKFNELQTTRQKKPIRAGRGISAGRGKTAGRGTKGQNARKSGGVRPGFEGGQSTLMQKMPKLRGFRSVKAVSYEVYTSDLNDLGAKVDNQALVDAGLVPDAYSSVKVLKTGELKKKVTVSLQAASAAAVKEIEKAGGSFVVTERLKRAPAKKNTKA